MSDVTPAEKAAEALEAARQEIYGWSVSEGFMPTETVMKQIDEALAALRSPPAAQTPVGVEAVGWPRIMYACEWCYEHNPEVCGHDRNDLSVSPDGEWLCWDCLCEHPKYDQEADYPSPPSLYSAADMARVMGERDEARDRVDELESYGDSVADEFERDLWKQVRALLDECDFEWGDVDPDGIYADQAAEHIRETLRGLEQDAERLRARAEAAEKEAAALREALVEIARDRGGFMGEYHAACQQIARAALTQGGTDGR